MGYQALESEIRPSPDPTDQYLMRALNTNIYNFIFSAAYFDQSGSTYQRNYPNSRVFGLAAGLASNDIFQTPVSRVTWPFYTWGEVNQAFTGAPFLGDRPVVANELFIQKIGNYSPNRLGFFGGEAPNSDYSYVEREGMYLKFGFSPGPINKSEQTMLRLNWFGLGNPGNSVQVDEGRLQSGTADNTDLVGELSLSSSAR